MLGTQAYRSWDMPYFTTSYKEASGLPYKAFIFFPSYYRVSLGHALHLLADLQGATLDEAHSIAQQSQLCGACQGSWSFQSVTAGGEHNCHGTPESLWNLGCCWDLVSRAQGLPCAVPQQVELLSPPFAYSFWHICLSL